MIPLKITSPAFKHNEMIPSKYTCEGQDFNPPLEIKNIPDSAKTLAIIVDDPDAPVGTWVHWVVWNIPTKEKIPENSVPGTEGINSFKRRSFGGPCPPSGTHRYFFKVYALDKTLIVSGHAKKQDVEKAMQGHILGQGELIGLYKKSK